MNIETSVTNGQTIAIVQSEEILVTDGASALDLLMSVHYESNARRVVLPKQVFVEDFFQLRTGVLGEVLQKCINYHFKLGIYGDFSVYDSKALRDFIYESNKGKDFFFVRTKEDAIACLAAAPES